MENFEISTPLPTNPAPPEPPQAAVPNEVDVDFFNSALHGDLNPSPYEESSSMEGSDTGLSKGQRDQMDRAFASGSEILSGVVGQLVSKDSAAASAIAAYATSLDPASATVFAEVAVRANPEAAVQIAVSVAEAAVQANPEQAPRVFAEIVNVVANGRPDTTARILASFLAPHMNSSPMRQSSNSLSAALGLLESVVAANPAGAPELALDIMKSALSLDPQSAPAVAEMIQTAINKTAPDFAAIVAVLLQNIQTSSLPISAPVISPTPASNVVQPFAPVAAAGGGAIPPGPASSPYTDTPSMSGQQVQGGFFIPQPITANATGATPAPEQASMGISENLLQLIANTVSRMEVGETRTIMVLQKTPELPGEVTLEVRMQNGALEVVFQTTDPKTRATLQNNISALQSRLQQASGATSVQIFLAGNASEDKVMDASDANHGLARDSKAGGFDEKGKKDKVQGKSKSGGAQQ